MIIQLQNNKHLIDFSWREFNLALLGWVGEIREKCKSIITISKEGDIELHASYKHFFVGFVQILWVKSLVLQKREEFQ